MAASGREKRVYSRMELDLLSYAGSEGAAYTLIKDISEGGVCFRSGSAIQPGTVIQVEVDGNNVDLTVLRSVETRDEAAPDSGAYDVHCKFEEGTPHEVVESLMLALMDGEG